MKESLSSDRLKAKPSALENKQLSGDDGWPGINDENIHSRQDVGPCNYSMRPDKR